MRRAILAVASLLGACVHDVVLPSPDSAVVCGDGILAPGEECDVASPGCVQCRILPDYTCTKAGCAVVCGDGVIGDGADCSNARKVEDCDMNGYWIARETDFSRDRIVNGIQVASTWYLYRFSQTGDAFQVEEALHCGIHVSGSASVDYTPGSLRALLYRNAQDPHGKHGPRRGTFRADGAGCAFSFDRWYSIRGAVADLLPADFSTHPALADLPKLPSESDPVHPTGTSLLGAEDTDGDGIPGASFRVAGFVPGVRNSAQRDFKQWATGVGQGVAKNTIQFVVPGIFDVQESVLAATECGTSCTLLALPADAAKDMASRFTFRFVGKTFGSDRVSAIVKGPPTQDLDTDLMTCANVRLALPHDPSHE